MLDSNAMLPIMVTVIELVTAVVPGYLKLRYTSSSSAMPLNPGAVNKT